MDEFASAKAKKRENPLPQYKQKKNLKVIIPIPLQ